MDCTTYMVNKQYPLRLSKELVEPKGDAQAPQKIIVEMELMND